MEVESVVKLHSNRLSSLPVHLTSSMHTGMELVAGLTERSTPASKMQPPTEGLLCIISLIIHRAYT